MISPMTKVTKHVNAFTYTRKLCLMSGERPKKKRKSAEVICSDEKVEHVDTSAIDIDRCPSVTLRLLGIHEDSTLFKDVKTNGFGQLTFAQDMGIEHKQFANAMEFLRSGRVLFTSLDAMKRTFDILGADEYFRQYVHASFITQHSDSC
jgi:hypothetical protein